MPRKVAKRLQIGPESGRPAMSLARASPFAAVGRSHRAFRAGYVARSHVLDLALEACDNWF